MEENKYGYDPSEDDGYDDNRGASVQKSIRGYRVVIVLLAVILAGLSALYFNLNRQQQHDYELLKIDRDSIQSNLSELIDEYGNLKFTNDTITANLEKANEMMEQLKRERRWNYAKIKEYEKEVGTLRAVMKNYLLQIDSLNSLNKKLIDENVSYRKEISTANLRADVAEERATELQNKVPDGFGASRARHRRRAAQRPRQGGFEGQGCDYAACGLHRFVERPGGSRQPRNICAHNLARRLSADDRERADIQVPRREHRLFGFA